MSPARQSFHNKIQSFGPGRKALVNYQMGWALVGIFLGWVVGPMARVLACADISPVTNSTVMLTTR
jgi:hypothetical protein